MRFRHTVVILGIALSGLLSSFSAEELYVVADLQTEWLVFDDGEYRPYTKQVDAGVDVIYFRLDVNRHKGRYLQIAGKYTSAIFVNGKLLASGKLEDGRYSMDSLRDEFFSSTLLIGVYAENIYPENLKTVIASTRKLEQVEITDVQRPRTYFHDFVVSGIISLFILLIIVTQLTKVPLSFFFWRRIFSVHESEEAQLYTRLASTTNILFYVFSSLIIAFYLMIIFHFTGDRFQVALEFRSESYFGTILKWGKLSTYLLIAFFVKIGLVMAFSRMFGMGDFFGFQVINWMRLVLVAFGTLTLILVVYFLSPGIRESVYIVFFWFLVLALSSWLIILFTKVARRPGFTLFHIFSYLCATEVIPLLISIKLLFH